MDLEILTALSTRERWDKYHGFVKLSSLTEESARILESMGEWYKANPSVSRISWKGFTAWFVMVRHAKLEKDSLALHQALLDKLGNASVAEEDIKPLLEGLARRDVASQIADVALRITDGDTKLDFDKIHNLLEDYERSSGKYEAISRDLGSFTAESIGSVNSPGLRWRLDQLNIGAGDLRKGDFVVLGKRPDSGGTTFMASEASYMAEQLPFDQIVLWCNNEEQGNKVRRRILQATLGWESEEIDNHLEEALEEYTGIMGGNPDKIMVFDRPKIYTRDVEWLAKRYNVGLFVFDQLRKFKGFDKEGDVERQESLANWAREMSKQYAPVKVVHQLGGDAENKQFPTMDMLYGSKTGIQGEADLIILLGRNVMKGNTRGLYLPKNKMLTPGDKSKRNGRWEIQIYPDIARFK